MATFKPAEKYAILEQFINYLLDGRLDYLFNTDLYKILLQGLGNEWDITDLSWRKIKFLIRSLEQRGTQALNLFWGMLDFIAESKEFRLKDLGVVIDLDEVQSKPNSQEPPAIIDKALIQDELSRIYFFPDRLWCEEENTGQRQQWQATGYYINLIATKDAFWFEYTYPQKTNPEEIGLTEARLLTEGSKFKIYPGVAADIPEKPLLVSAYDFLMRRAKTDPRYIYVYKAGELYRYHFDENARQIPTVMIWGKNDKQWHEKNGERYIESDNDLGQLANEYAADVVALDRYRADTSAIKWQDLFDGYASKTIDWAQFLLDAEISLRECLKSYQQFCGAVKDSKIEVDIEQHLANLKLSELQKLFANDSLMLDRKAAISSIEFLQKQIFSDIQRTDVITKAKLSDLHNELLLHRLKLERQIQTIEDLKVPTFVQHSISAEEIADSSSDETTTDFESDVEEENSPLDPLINVTADTIPTASHINQHYGYFFTINPIHENSQSCKDRMQICIKNAAGLIEVAIEFGINELTDELVDNLKKGQQFVAHSGYCYTLKLDQRETSHTITAELAAANNSENDIENNNSEEDV